LAWAIAKSKPYINSLVNRKGNY